MYSKLKFLVPPSFNILLGDMPEESKNNTLDIPIIQIAIAGTEGQKLCLELSSLFREDGSNAVSLTEQPVSHLETETYNPQERAQISRVQAKYNANILLIQTQLQHLTPDIIISNDEDSINVLDTSERIIHSLPICNEMDEELILRTYKLLYSLFEIEHLG